MVGGIVKYEEYTEDDLTEYIFNVDGYDINYSFVFFSSQEDLFSYNLYPEGLLDEVPNAKTIVEIDWDFEEEQEEKPILNVFKLFRYINEVGKIYIGDKEPDCVIFDAEDSLFYIHKRFLENYGYKYYTKHEDTYIFIRK